MSSRTDPDDDVVVDVTSLSALDVVEINTLSSLIVSYFFTFLLFGAPLRLVVGAKKYFFGALCKSSGVMRAVRWHPDHSQCPQPG